MYLNLEMLQKATRSQAKHQDLISARLKTRTWYLRNGRATLLELESLPLSNLSTKNLVERHQYRTCHMWHAMIRYLKNLKLSF